jgi:excisionase family DNA binding protein
MIDESLLTLDETAEKLGISKVTLWRWVKDGKLAVVRLSPRVVYVRKEELRRFILAAEKKT